jgi:hypothetical protein
MRVNPEDPRAEDELEAFFGTLAMSARHLETHWIEKLMIELGMLYLHVESKTRSDRRDHTSVKRVWLVLHPYLEKHKMLDRFKSNVRLKNSLLFFVRNGFF